VESTDGELRIRLIETEAVAETEGEIVEESIKIGRGGGVGAKVEAYYVFVFIVLFAMRRHKHSSPDSTMKFKVDLRSSLTGEGCASSADRLNPNCRLQSIITDNRARIREFVWAKSSCIGLHSKCQCAISLCLGSRYLSRIEFDIVFLFGRPVSLPSRLPSLEVPPYMRFCQATLLNSASTSSKALAQLSFSTQLHNTTIHQQLLHLQDPDSAKR
jgi:hypothetical protein